MTQPTPKKPRATKKKIESRVETKDFGQSDAYSDLAGWTSLFGGPYGFSHTGLEVNPVTTLQSGVAYSCIRILCGDVAKLPLRLMRRQGSIWVEAAGHPLNRLLRRPNKRMTAFDMKMSWVSSLLLVGNAYTAVIRDKNNATPLEIVPLLPTTVSVREDGEGNIFYYVLNRLFANRHNNNFTEEDMVHARLMSLDGGIRGASPVQICSEVLGLSLATQELAATFFKNSANFNGVIESEKALTKEAVGQVRDEWQKNQGGIRGAYKTPIMPPGMTFRQIGMSAEQAQMIAAREAIVAEVAMLFGVPLSKLGISDKSSYNTIDAQQQDYIDSTLIPITKPIEEALDRVLLFEKELDDYRFEFDFSALEKGDLNTRSALWHQLLTDGVLCVDEVRKDLNLGPLPDGIGRVYTKPLNTGTVGQQEGLPMVGIGNEAVDPDASEEGDA